MTKSKAASKFRGKYDLACRSHQSRDPSLRQGAIDDLWEMFWSLSSRSPLRKGILRVVRAGLADRNYSVRNRATEAIGDIGSRADLPALIELTRDRAWMVRASAYSAIASVGRVNDLPYVLQGLKDRYAPVRRYAVVAAYDLAGCKALEPVRLAAIRDKNRIVRCGYAFVFAACGDPVALEELKLLAEEADPWISSPASDLLKEVLTGVEDRDQLD